MAYLTTNPHNAGIPARRAIAINTGSGDVSMSLSCRALYVGTGGNIVLRLADDTADVTVSNVVGGTVLPLQTAIIRQTGTTAADILALY